MSKHTPGPWEYEKLHGNGNDAGDYGVYEGADRSCRVARIENDDATGEDKELAEICRANARLVSAAPDLLAALRTLVVLDRKFSTDKEWAQAVYAAEIAIRNALGMEVKS